MPAPQPQVIYLPAERDTTALGANMLMQALQQMVSSAERRRDAQRRDALLKQQQERQARLDAEAAEDRSRRIETEDITKQRGDEAAIAALAPQLSMYEPAEPTVAEAPNLAVPGEEDLDLPPEPESVQLGTERMAPPLLTEITLPTGQKIPFNIRPSAERSGAEAQAAVTKAMQELGMKTEIQEKTKAQYREPKVPTYKEWIIDGKRGVYTPEEVAEAKAAGKSVSAYHAPQQAPSGQIDAAEAKATAESWRDGRAYPSSQRATGAAEVWMAAHPEDFPAPLPRKLTPSQQDRVLAATASLDRVKAIRESYDAVKNKIGPVRYQLNELGVKVPGIAEDPDFVTFNTALRQLDNLDIKRITGAQMSEKEADRLMKGMATGGLKPKDFEAALRIMEMDAEREREITLYGARQAKTKAPAAGKAETPGGGAGTEEWIRDPTTGKLRRK